MRGRLPGAVASGQYLPCIYTQCSAESIFDHAKKHWFEREKGRMHFTPTCHHYDHDEAENGNKLATTLPVSAQCDYNINGCSLNRNRL